MKSPFHLDQQNADIDSRILVALERLSEVFRILLWRETRDRALSPIQIQFLIFLLTHKASLRKVSVLAREFNLTQATVSDAVRVLEEKELIRRLNDPTDLRSHLIELTKKGKTLAAQMSSFANELLVPIRDLHRDDKEALLLSLLKIIRHLTDAGVIHPNRICLTCAHFRKAASGEKHFCTLLNARIGPGNLRVDCPDHTPAIS